MRKVWAHGTRKEAYRLRKFEEFHVCDFAATVLLKTPLALNPKL